MPLLGGYLQIRSSQGAPPSSYHLKEPVITFPRIGPCDVIVVRVFQPKSQSSRLVHVAGNGFESYRYLKITKAAFIDDEQRKPVIGRINRGLRHNVGPGWSGGIRQDDPLT